MAKKKTNKSNGRDDRPRRERKPVGHDGGKRVSALRNRVNTIPSNGDLPASVEVAPEGVPISEAMRQAVEALGDITIDDTLAPSQLRQLAEAFEEVTKAQAAFNAKSEAAKTAKKSLEGATEFLLARVKEFTHPTPLPLFDQAQAEGDLSAMTGAPLDNTTGTFESAEAHA